MRAAATPIGDGDAIVHSARAAGKRLGVERLPGLIDEALQPLSLEVDGLTQDRQAPTPLMQLVVIGVDALWLSHTSIVGSNGRDCNEWEPHGCPPRPRMPVVAQMPLIGEIFTKDRGLPC